MWKSETELQHGGQILKLSLLSQDNPLSYSAIIDLWQHNPDFRSFFISLLAGAPFAAYFWETPPVTLATVEQDFEFVLVNSPELAGVSPQPWTFQDYFPSAPSTNGVNNGVVTFPNLGNDALLVVPCPNGPDSAYSHIAAFTRTAPEPQQQALWQRVGETLARHLSEQPVWLSTAGLGVYWLHIRLDSIPKYYSYTPYKSPGV